jgi:hypothetical protein
MSDQAQETTIPDSVPAMPDATIDTGDTPDNSGADVGGFDNQDYQEPNQGRTGSEVDDYRRRAEEAEARMSAYREVYSQGLTERQRSQQEAAERERIMNMTPEERLVYAAEQQEIRLQRIAADAERRIADANDRAAYAAMKAANPIAAKYEKEVEKRIQDARAQGYNYSRELMLTFIAGEKALAAAKSGGNDKQKKMAEENRQKSTTSATTASGDKSPKSTPMDDRAARNERLRKGKYGSL